MSEPDPDSTPPDIRASDADRERVAERVREAVGDGRLTMVEGDERLASAYAARLRRELEPVLADLGGLPAEITGQGPAGSDVPARTGGVPAPSGGRPSTTSSVSVLGGNRRDGDWTPGATHVSVAVMGGSELDLRAARLDRRGLTLVAVAIMGGTTVDLRGVDAGGDPIVLRVAAIMGGVEVIVDETTRIENRAFGILGGVDPGGPAIADPSGRPAPVVRIEGVVIMGGISVSRRGGGGLPSQEITRD